MERVSLLLHLLLMCSSDTNLLIRVNAQAPELIITKASPAVVIRENDLLQLRCNAPYPPAGTIMVWSSLNEVVARNGTSLDARHSVLVLQSSPTSSEELLTISDISRDDSGIICELRDSSQEGNPPVASAVFDFSVLHFPDPIYPICFPDGSFDARGGTIIHMNFTTELGNPPVEIERSTAGIDYNWSISAKDIFKIQTLQLVVSEADEGIFFNFTITSPQEFPGQQSSCLIGPISVYSGTDPPHQPPKITTQESLTTSYHALGETKGELTSIQSAITTLQPTDQQVSNSTTPWIVVSSVGLILLIVSLFINIFFIRQRHRKKLTKKARSIPDPYTELQPRDSGNRVYMEPAATEPTPDRHTYTQTIETENLPLDDGYETPQNKVGKLEKPEGEQGAEPEYLTIEA